MWAKLFVKLFPSSDSSIQINQVKVFKYTKSTSKLTWDYLNCYLDKINQ